jgi:pyridoxine 5-phosphate synthase
MATLAVNVDHIATLRQARGVTYPDPVAAAALAELAGADGIVVHLREDRRHIQDRDVRILRETVQTKLILEMAATPEMIGIAVGIKPDLVTLVPEKREELTTEGGLDLITNRDHIADAVATLKRAGIPTSIFVDPDPEQITLAHQIEAAKVEIHTGTFCDAVSPDTKAQAFAAIVEAARLAARLKLGVNAGHGIDYQTIQAFRGLSEIDEFSIGHSIVSRAALVGMDRAVREMVALVEKLK